MSDWETLGISLKLINLSGMHPQKVNKPLFLFNFVILTTITVLIVANVIVNFHLSQLEAISYIYYIWIKFGGIWMLKRRPLTIMLEMIRKFKPNDFLSHENLIYRKYIKWLKFYVFYIMVCLIFIVGNSFATGTPTIFESYLPRGVPQPLLYFAELYVLFPAYCSIVGASLLTSTLLLSVAQQFSLLSKKIKTLDLTQTHTEDGLNSCLKNLKEGIACHIFLLKCIVQLNEILSMPLLLQLGGDIYLLCVHMYFISSSQSTVVDLFRHGVMNLEVIVSFLFLYGYPSQLLMEMAESVGESVYCHCDWYIPDIVPIRRTLLLMLVRSQRTIAITAGGFTDVNNRTLLFILKTAYSFYTYLQTVS